MPIGSANALTTAARPLPDRCADPAVVTRSRTLRRAEVHQKTATSAAGFWTRSSFNQCFARFRREFTLADIAVATSLAMWEHALCRAIPDSLVRGSAKFVADPTPEGSSVVVLAGGAVDAPADAVVVPFTAQT